MPHAFHSLPQFGAASDARHRIGGIDEENCLSEITFNLNCEIVLWLHAIELNNSSFNFRGGVWWEMRTLRRAFGHTYVRVYFWGVVRKIERYVIVLISGGNSFISILVFHHALYFFLSLLR